MNKHFREIKPNERFHFINPILNTKNGLIRLSVYNSVFNIIERNNQFKFTKPQTFHQVDAAKEFIIPPESHELTDMVDITKQETNDNVLTKVDKNTLKCKMEVLQGVINFDVENSVASLLGFDKQIYSRCKYSSNKIIDIMGFKTINIYWNIISGAKDNGKDTDIIYTFNLTEPAVCLIYIIPTNILYQKLTKDRIEYIEFHIKNENGRPIDLMAMFYVLLYIWCNQQLC